MDHYAWDKKFRELFEKCASLYKSGNADFSSYYDASDSQFLDDIGCKPRELFDFVEDFVDGDGDPSMETAILIASVRRDYLATVQKSVKSEIEMQTDELPGREDELDGFRWLPRIIQKARNKLRGENCPDIMYGCGGDRGFLKPNNIHPADFLRVVWSAGDDDSKIVEYVKSHSGESRG